MIDKALARYCFRHPRAELIRHNENMTYKVSDGELAYVLRIHKPAQGFNLGLLCAGMDIKHRIADEMRLLEFLAARGNVRVQQVKPNACGQSVTTLCDGTAVTVLEWIEGATLDDIEITPEIACSLGAMLGRLHNNLAQCTFDSRYYYDSDLLAKMIDEANKASLCGKHTKIIVAALSHIRRYLHGARGSFIPVHADLSKSNLIYSSGSVVPIDFSLSGYCVPEMDLASAFSHINDDELNQRLLDGYKSSSRFQPTSAGIEACFCLQILLFVVCQHSRFANQAWFNEKLDHWCQAYFAPLCGNDAK